MVWIRLHYEDELSRRAVVESTGNRLYVRLNAEVKRWLDWREQDICVRYVSRPSPRLVLTPAGPGQWRGLYRKTRGYRIDLGSKSKMERFAPRVGECSATGKSKLTVTLPPTPLLTSALS